MKDPEIKKQFEYFNKTFQLIFPDVDIDAYFQIGNGAIDALGVGIAETEFEITMDSSVFFGILEKSVDAEEAYASGKIVIRGDSTDLKKLKLLL